MVLSHLKEVVPIGFDCHQFAYRANRCTDDAVILVLHKILSHLENKNLYARALFVDCSSAFNTVIPSVLVDKLLGIGFDIPMCNWLLDFLTDRPQSVKIGSVASSERVLNVGAPQGCVFKPVFIFLVQF